MATWNTRGLRGSVLEDMINFTNTKYQEKGLCLIQKIPTPIKPIKMDKESRHITLAYFEQKSTVDYIGVVQGIPVCFDAKECNRDSFSLANIHKHQYEFMKEFERQEGIAFIILYFTHVDEAFYIPFRDIEKFYLRAINGGKKSFNYSELNKEYHLQLNRGIPIHYLEALNKDLNER